MIFNDAKIVRMTICDKDVACHAAYETRMMIHHRYRRHATSNIKGLLTRTVHMQFAVIAHTKPFIEFHLLNLIFSLKEFPIENDAACGIIVY